MAAEREMGRGAQGGRNGDWKRMSRSRRKRKRKGRGRGKGKGKGERETGWRCEGREEGTWWSDDTVAGAMGARGIYLNRWGGGAARGVRKARAVDG